MIWRKHARSIVSICVLLGSAGGSWASAAETGQPSTRPMASGTDTAAPNSGEASTSLLLPERLPSATGKDLASLSLEDLMNVQVTSVSKTRQRIADAPAAVTVIDQDDIQRSGLREIPEMLRLAPGLFVQQGN